MEQNCGECQEAQRRRPRVLALLALVILTIFTSALDASSARAVATQSDFFGLSSIGQLANENEAAEMQYLGVHNVRDNISWFEFQHSGCAGVPEGPMDYSGFDQKVRNAASHGITIIANLYATLIPSGIGCSHDLHEFPLQNATTMYNDYVKKGGFAWSVVQRYGVNGTFWKANPGLPQLPIRVWEVWNEQNLPSNSWGKVVNPQGYAKFLIDTSAAIRQAQEEQAGQPVSATGTKVLMGGLTSFSSGMSIASYFNQMYNKPAGYSTTQLHGAFDGLSYHPYALAGTPSAVIGEIQNARTVLNNYADSDKTLWLTEIGWPVGSFPGGGGAPAYSMNETTQAQYLKEVFTWIYSHADYPNFIRYAAAYVYQDNGDCGEWACWDRVSGLKRSDGSDKPAWCTYKTMIVGSCQIPGWHNDNIGGSISADPDIAAWAPGRLDVFGKGADSSLVHRAFSSGSTWAPWESLGNTLTSGVGAVSWGADRIDVVARDTGNQVSHWAWNGSSWGGDKLGGTIAPDPDVSSWGPNRLDVFVRGGENVLWHKYWNGLVWSAWESLGGPLLTSAPSAVSWGSNRIDVVARTTDNSVAHWWFDGTSWHSNDNLGGTVASAPEITSWGPGRLDVFAAGSESGLWHKYFYSGSTWSAWERLGGYMLSGPGAVAWGPNRIDVVFRTGNSSVAHWWYDG